MRDSLGGLTQELLDSAPDAVVIVGDDGLIRFANKQVERLFGYERMELIGKDIEILVPDRVKKIHSNHRSAYFASPTTRPMGAGLELTARRKDGTEFHADISLSSIETEEGPIVSAAVRDISERIRQAQDTERLEIQLRRSRMESIGQLAGGIAHDFNNLLGGIMTYANLVREDLLVLEQAAETASLVDDVDQIIRATERAANLTRQLLLFGRKDVARSQVLDLNAIVIDMEAMLQRTLGEPIELSTSLDPSLPAVDMNEGHVEQTLMNLVVNARDAMPSGGRLMIRTTLAALDEDYAWRSGIKTGVYVCLSVADTGAGMPPDVAARVFEPYFTTKPLGEGSGLGLATVYGIVSRVDGHIAIYSEPGLGTQVKVYIPPVDASPSASVATKKEPGSTRGETILLVEDEEVVREPAARFLTRAGYELLVAENAEEALEISQSHTGAIDLLLTDVVMPGMNGRELAERLIAARPKIDVIYMSGYSPELITFQDDAIGEVVLVEKPFTADLLLTTVREVLDRHDGRS